MDNPRLGHFRRPGAGRRLPGVGRMLRWLAAAAVIALAAPVEAQQAAGSTYGPVRRADTIWELALRFRGEARVNARQAMIAILRANPEAFVEGNINALRAGVTLRVPTVAEMEAVTPGEAAAEFARHDEAWRNRRRTGSAAPGPAPRAPPAPRPSPAPTPERTPEDGGGAAEELRKARETVADLRERLSERDEAIEELLVQLATVQRELRVLREKAGPAPSAESAPPEGEAAGGGAASAPSWLPVNPLILGSSLIVLLVLIVVVTLLRQRGEAEETLPEDPFDEEGDDEDAGGERPPGEPRDPEDERTDRRAGTEEAAAARGREPASPGTASAGAVAVASATSEAAGAAAGATEAGAAEHELEGDGETAEVREEEAADLPIGMDLDGEDRWDRDPAPEGSTPDRPAPQGPEEPLEFGRHVEVGELDRIDFDGDPTPGSLPEVSIDLGEGDEPPEGGPAPGRARPGRARRGRRK